jgi:outer membrane receptor protein involved in Fe transport
MHMIRRTKTTLYVHVAALAMISQPALAAAAADAAADTAADPGEIVVTANRREQTIQRAALSISAVTGQDIQARGIFDYDSLVRAVPGVIATGGGMNFSKLTVRGIETSQTNSSIGAQRSVSIYLDDLPLTSFTVVTPDLPLNDIARVEVLRGPQGTLFGAGSLAGAVRYITNKPDLSTTSAGINLDVGVNTGSSWRRRGDAYVNIPLVNDKLALRVAASYRNEDGYIENVATGIKNANGLEDWGIRAALKWQVNDRLSATLTGSHNSNRADDLALFNPVIGFHKSSLADPFRVSSKLSTGNLAINFDAGFADITALTSYGEAPSDWNLSLDAIIPGIPLFLKETVSNRTFVQEVRLVSKQTGSFDWVIGGYYLQQKSDVQDVLHLTTAFVNAINLRGLITGIAPGSAYSNSIETRDNRELAGFGEVNFQATDTLKLTAGVRVTDASFTSALTGEGSVATNFFPALFGALFNPVAGADVTLARQLAASYPTGHKVTATPKFVVNWQPNPESSFYASASQGFRRAQPNGVVAGNGGVSLINPNDPAIIPFSAAGDSLWNYELGAKFKLLEGRVRANFAAYLIDWSNMQIPLVRSSDQAPYVGNIGKARSYGLEGEISAQPTDTTLLGLNFTIQEAKVVKISADQALISGAIADAALASPKFKIGGYVRQAWTLGNDTEAFVRIDAVHVGSYVNGFPNTPGTKTLSPTFTTIPAYEKVDASIGLLRGNIAATVYVENLFDTKTYTYINPANFNSNRFATLRPRTFGVRLSYKL